MKMKSISTINNARNKLKQLKSERERAKYLFLQFTRIPAIERD